MLFEQPSVMFQLSALSLGAIAILSFLSRLCSKPRQHRTQDAEPRIPPTKHSLIPFISDTLSFVFSPRKFMMDAGQYMNQCVPNRVPLLLGDIYVIRGPESISTLFKESANSSSMELHGFFFGLIFNMPKKAQSLYTKDDSGFGTKPHPNSKALPNNRIDHITHQVLKEFLLSERSAELAPRFAARIEDRFANLDINDVWVEKPDLLSFLEIELIRANIEVVYGPLMFEIHPTFCEDFWCFSHHLYGFYRPYPNWTVPKAFAARKTILSAVKEWQRRIVEDEKAEDLYTDAYWGPSQVRKWHNKFMQMEGFDEEAIASLYLGIIWVSNYNFIISVFWMILETYRSSTLLAQVRQPLSPLSPQLLAKNASQFPLIQSVYAETLRLRTEAYITRRFPHKPVVLGEKWVIPQDKICLASSHPAHQDAAVWNTKHGAHPLDTFWAERFLIYPSDPESGPLKSAYREHRLATDMKRSGRESQSEHRETADGGPSFSLEGLSASWIPYGGGPRACPGRYIAKQQILSCFASFVQNFDVELLCGEEAWKMDERSYGPGVQLPVDKVAFRIRRRDV